MHSRDHYRSYSTERLVEEARFKIHPELVEALIERLDMMRSSNAARLYQENDVLREALASERREVGRLHRQIAEQEKN
jgi:plasmid maintenance system killer protein